MDLFDIIITLMFLGVAVLLLGSAIFYWWASRRARRDAQLQPLLGVVLPEEDKNA